MSTIASSPTVIHGILKTDGTLELETKPQLPPGRVLVTLQLLTDVPPAAIRLPDPPWPDESISAPFDLPHLNPGQPIEVKLVTKRLPEPFEWDEESGS